MEKEAKKLEYIQSDKLSWEDFKKSFPKELIPTQKTGYILGAIFIIVTIWGFMHFPFGSIMSGRMDISLKVGIPMTFFELSFENPETFPLILSGLIVDTLIYLIIAYAIDVSINVFLRSTMYHAINQDKKKIAAKPRILIPAKNN